MHVVKCVVLVSFLTEVVCYYKNEVTWKCGPDEKCACKNATAMVQMDCSYGHNISIKDICEYIHLAEIKVRDLKAGALNIASIDRDDMKYCSGLSMLDLQDNQLVFIEQGVFDGFEQLKYLDLRQNFLKVYNASFNSSVLPQNLEVLSIAGNLAHTVPINFVYPNLSGLTKLKSLYLDGVNTNFGSHYENLELDNLTISLGVKFTVCDIFEVSNDTFSNLRHVRNLDLSGCPIENIHAGAFERLSKLERLDLSLNRRLGFSSLINVSYGLQFTNISFLNYSKVHSTFGLGTEVLKRDLCYLRNTSLKELAIDGNRIQLFENDALLLMPRGFKVMHVNDNMFTFGPYLLQLACVGDGEEFYGDNQQAAHDPKLYLLEPPDKKDTRRDRGSDCPFMSENHLKKIASEVEHCSYIGESRMLLFNPAIPKGLKVLHFSSGDISYAIDVAIKITPANNSLEYVDFSKNALYSWEKPVRKFPNIKYIDLSQNYCTYIGPEFFNDLKSLEELQIHTNLLGSFLSDKTNGAVFEGLHNLRILNISGNRITEIHSPTFDKLKNLESIDISSNNIEKFGLNMKHFPNLTKLHLAFNFIGTLSEDTRNQISKNAARLDKQFRIDMRSNTIPYTCKNREFLEWMVKHETNMIGIRQYIFVNDEKQTLSYEFVKKSLQKLEKSCRSFTLIYVIASSGISIFLCTIVGGMIYKNRWKLRYFMFMSRAKFSGYRRTGDYKIIENYKYDAFISYAEEDIDFIKSKIIPSLENRDMSLCIHQRDFLAGIPISDNIISAIRASRKTVVILSRQFLKKKWCMYEFNMARMESIYSRDESGCLVIVRLEDVPARDMPPEMLEWIQKHSYLEYTTDEQGQVVFWENLRLCIRP